MTRFRIPAALALAGAIAAGATLAPAARAAERIQLKFADPGRPGDWVYKGIEHLTTAIEKGSGGQVEIKIYAGGSIANFRNVYDRLLNGVVDGAFGTFGGIEDQYRKTSVSGLPFVADLSSEAGLAMWRLYASGMTADEYTKVKPLAMFGFGVAGLHLAEPIEHIDDLKGLKILVNGRSAGKIAAALGATPITSSPAELYQGLSRGLAQGIEFTFTGLVAFKIYPLTKYHLDAPFGTTGGYFFFNKQSYERLPQTVRQAIDRAGGEPATKDMGKRADDEDDRTRNLVLGTTGHKFIKLPPAEVAKMKKMVAVYTEEWVKSTPNGAAVLAAYTAAVEKIKKGM
jgi:TRAP-type C4-dicarboxylate transport system substrate-binding protein